MCKMYRTVITVVFLFFRQLNVHKTVITFLIYCLSALVVIRLLHMVQDCYIGLFTNLKMELKLQLFFLNQFFYTALWRNQFPNFCWSQIFFMNFILKDISQNVNPWCIELLYQKETVPPLTCCTWYLERQS